MPLALRHTDQDEIIGVSDLDQSPVHPGEVDTHIIQHHPHFPALNEPQQIGALALHIIDAVKKYGADAVVVCMMKFCDPEEFDYPILLQEFEAAGVKNLYIEVDQESTAFEQVKTRIQTFAETL